MIEIAPELSPQGHCSSLNFRILGKNLDYKPQSSDSPSGDLPGGDLPGGDSPGGDSPGGDSPGGDSPGGDSPGGSLCESLSDILSSLSSDL